MDEKEKRQILGESEKVLTNYFNKEMGLQSSIADRLNFSIRNKRKNNVNVALATGHLPVDGIDVVTEDGQPAYRLHHHDTSRLAGIGYTGIDAILDDNIESADASGDKLTIVSNDSDVNIRSVIEYLNENPRYVKSVTITTNDSAFFDGGAFSFATLNPFHRENSRDVNLTRFFSVNQYQQGKIVIDYAPNELQWNDNLYWVVKGIPMVSQNDDVVVSFIIEFYD